jgi:hypothetical protein
MGTRRTIREFSARPVPFEPIRNAVATAATAPSGANLQPWRFVVVPVGHAAEETTVPDLDRKRLEEVLIPLDQV